MTGSEWMALAAVVLCAVAVLPGTLGILMLTHKLAADETGARFIYGQAAWVLALSAITLVVAIVEGLSAGGLTTVTWLATIAYAGIMVFGFFMHTTRMFKPVRKPAFISMDEALRRFGPDEEVVGVIDQQGKPYAFIARLARRPHVIYQPEGDAPFIMTHCILAHSSMSYALEGQFSTPDILITAVLANNMVFYDKSSRCSVTQLENQSRHQNMALQTVATLSLRLSTWQSLYPDSGVWVRPKEWRDVFYLKLLARADVIDPASPVKVYALQHPQDERLPMKSLVLGVRSGTQSRTYPVSVFAQQPLLNDRLGDKDLLLVSAFEQDYIQVFEREIEPGVSLSFRPVSQSGGFADDQTGSEWNLQGRCTSGHYAGHQLRPYAHYNKIFWYVWADFFPGTEIYSQAVTDGESQPQAVASSQVNA